MESYFMGIDTGTNSSKGVLINSHGEIIAEYTTEHAMTNPAPATMNTMQTKTGGEIFASSVMH